MTDLHDDRVEMKIRCRWPNCMRCISMKCENERCVFTGSKQQNHRKLKSTSFNVKWSVKCRFGFVTRETEAETIVQFMPEFIFDIRICRSAVAIFFSVFALKSGVLVCRVTTLDWLWKSTWMAEQNAVRNHVESPDAHRHRRNRINFLCIAPRLARPRQSHRYCKIMTLIIYMAFDGLYIAVRCLPDNKRAHEIYSEERERERVKLFYWQERYRRWWPNSPNKL